jgi:hypothetical protein
MPVANVRRRGMGSPEPLVGWEVRLPEQRSEHQAPRRTTPPIVPDAIAEPPSERSVFGEPDRRVAADRSGTPLPRIFTGGVGCVPETPHGKLSPAHRTGR